jgi:hypothetical protein
MEHLLTSCTARGNRANLRKARRVTECYTFLYNVISVGCNDDGFTHIPLAQRMDDQDFDGRWDEDDNGLWTCCFDTHFDKTHFTNLGPIEYVAFLVGDCHELFYELQCKLALRMRTQFGKCELGARHDLLQDMHMTTDLPDFVDHLRTRSKESVADSVVNMRDIDLIDDPRYDPNIWNYRYDHVTPSGIFTGDYTWTYITAPTCYQQRTHDTERDRMQIRHRLWLMHGRMTHTNTHSHACLRDYIFCTTLGVIAWPLVGSIPITPSLMISEIHTS